MADAKYSPEEERAIRERLVAGEPAMCPQCGVTMTVRRIGGGSFGLGYARQREWLICPKCHRSAIFDVKRGTRN
jgi:transposase-like protein